MDLGLFKIGGYLDLGLFKIGGYLNLGLFKIKGAKCLLFEVHQSSLTRSVDGAS